MLLADAVDGEVLSLLFGEKHFDGVDDLLSVLGEGDADVLGKLAVENHLRGGWMEAEGEAFQVLERQPETELFLRFVLLLEKEDALLRQRHESCVLPPIFVVAYDFAAEEEHLLADDVGLVGGAAQDEGLSLLATRGGGPVLFAALGVIVMACALHVLYLKLNNTTRERWLATIKLPLIDSSICNWSYNITNTF